ncbi:hypothetical protein BRC91_06405 [Halobacteriales archaeon QS_4_62_28]|nr:MAG: hypothetical protein BRC91_06405 [Halobacteriales archaeon QS_4_62_28]
MSDPQTTARRTNWGNLAVALGVTLVGGALLGGLVYAEVTTTVTRADFDAYQQNCDDLAGQTRLVESGGIGMERVRLNQTHVDACEQMTLVDYRQQRLQSMQSTPLNAAQWAWFGTGGVVITVVGVVLLGQELAAR